MEFAQGTGAVLLQGVGREVLKQCTRSAPQGVIRFWTPAQTDVQRIEEMLPLVIDSVLRKVTNSSTQLDARQYYRQYLGIQRWSGKRSIYINAFHKRNLEEINRALQTGRKASETPDSLEWRTNPVSVCDGGTLFFGVEFDPETRTFGRIEFNDRVSGAVTY
jgi:hypothetical protein